MKKVLLFLLLSAIACTSEKPKNKTGASDLNVDFPVADTCVLKPVGREIETLNEIKQYYIADSIVWIFQDNNENCGYCYNINTGEKVSTIANKGRANNELFLIYNQNINPFMGDSVSLIAHKNLVTFNTEDITTNKPMSERNYSLVQMVDSIVTFEVIKLGNGSLFGNIVHADTKIKGGISDYKYFISDGREITYLGRYNLEIYESDREITPLDIDLYYGYWLYSTHGNKIVTLLGNGRPEFNVIDIDKKEVVAERRYFEKLKIEESGSRPKNFRTSAVNTTDENIFIATVEYDVDKENKNNNFRYSVYVYDWELNPIKKVSFKVPKGSSNLQLSNDCSKLYTIKEVEDGKYQLFAADINM